MPGKEKLRRYKTKHRIPQELQPLIAVKVCGPMLVGIGAVIQCLLQQRGISECIIQFFSSSCMGDPFYKGSPAWTRGTSFYDFTFEAI